MRRPPRPFTVEIKSSRRPARIRKATPTLVDRPRAEPLFQDLLRGVLKVGQDRRPGSGSSPERGRLRFQCVGHLCSRSGSTRQSAHGGSRRPQRSKRFRLSSLGEPSACRTTAGPCFSRDLLSLSRASEPLSPAAERHSALSRKQQSPGMQEWAEPGAAETSPDLDQVVRFEACQQYGEPPEIEGPAPPSSPGIAAAGQGDLPPGRNREVITSPESTHPGWAVARAIVAQAGCIERHVGKPSAGASLCPSGQPVRSGNVVEPRHARLMPGAAWVPVPGARSEWSSGAAVIGEPGPTICRSSLDDTRM